LAADCDIVIVVGSPNSSNSNRLREVATQRGVEAYMVDNASLLQREWFDGKNKVGVTAGASAPEVLVQQVIQQIKDWGVDKVEQGDAVDEHMVFALPKELRE
jgi:lytB protein